MIVTPLPGTNRDNLLQTLQQTRTTVSNLYTSAKLEAPDRLVAYLQWAADTARLLHGQIHERDIDRLVFTRGHAQLIGLLGSVTNRATWQVLQTLLSHELAQRTTAFTEAADALALESRRWEQPGRVIMFDSTVYIHNPDKLEELDFLQIVNHYVADPLHMIVPMVVLDELERLKEASKIHTRWRARYSLAVLDRVCQTNGRGLLRAADFTVLGTDTLPKPQVTAEIVLDPRGHIRLPIDDDEIVDRALALEPLAGRPITLITYDTNQSTRARMAGLDVIKHDMPPEDPEPAKAPAQRRQRGSNTPAAT